MQAKSVELPRDFVVAMQDMFLPVESREFDRPANILRYEGSLGPAVRMAPLGATIQIAFLIMKLRQIALNNRVAEARLKGTTPLGANVPLTREEVGIVMESWRSEFREQELTKQQAGEDERESCTGNQKRKRMRGRWFAYQERLLGNRKLGMALITLGFDVDLKKLATVYAQTTADGDASSLPSRDLRQRSLEARAWYRWGRQLFNSVESDEVAWDSLEPTAQEAYRWFVEGWSAKECDRLTQEYGHGMLRSGCANGSFVGQQARGSVVDRLRMQFLDECL